MAEEPMEPKADRCQSLLVESKERVVPRIVVQPEARAAAAAPHTEARAAAVAPRIEARAAAVAPHTEARPHIEARVPYAAPWVDSLKAAEPTVPRVGKMGLATLDVEVVGSPRATDAMLQALHARQAYVADSLKAAARRGTAAGFLPVVDVPKAAEQRGTAE